MQVRAKRRGFYAGYRRRAGETFTLSDPADFSDAKKGGWMEKVPGGDGQAQPTAPAAQAPATEPEPQAPAKHTKHWNVGTQKWQVKDPDGNVVVEEQTKEAAELQRARLSGEEG